jgi:quercetin dioxygenase-like cupin family protein
MTVRTDNSRTTPNVRALRGLSALLAATLLVAGCGSDGDANNGPSDASRVELATARPTNAPGQQLYLQEVTIPGGVTLQKHIHEGTQIASVRSGTLTYVIESGSTLVTRADGTEEQFTGPTTIELQTGDSLVESEELVHYGQNLGDETVVVTLAVLLREGAPLATTVD